MTRGVTHDTAESWLTSKGPSRDKSGEPPAEGTTGGSAGRTRGDIAGKNDDGRLGRSESISISRSTSPARIRSIAAGLPGDGKLGVTGKSTVTGETTGAYNTCSGDAVYGRNWSCVGNAISTGGVVGKPTSVGSSGSKYPAGAIGPIPESAKSSTATGRRLLTHLPRLSRGRPTASLWTPESFPRGQHSNWTVQSADLPTNDVGSAVVLKPVEGVAGSLTLVRLPIPGHLGPPWVGTVHTPAPPEPASHAVVPASAVLSSETWPPRPRGEGFPKVLNCPEPEKAEYIAVRLTIDLRRFANVPGSPDGKRNGVTPDETPCSGAPETRGSRWTGAHRSRYPSGTVGGHRSKSDTEQSREGWIGPG